ncbi:MAG: alpha/beta hydrolase [Balneolaceae bacterium]|nr:alpha/beta hydrolase [Balneolaceae bacterium]
MPYIDVGGATLYYEDHGPKGETIVFAHGLLYNTRMYEKQIEFFSDRYRCIVFDFRGHGNSEVTERGYDMDTLAEDTANLILNLQADPCHFVGFSMGGFVALRLALHHPNLLKSLVLVDTSAETEPVGNIPKYKLMNWVARWIGPWAVANRVLPIMFSDEFLNDPRQSELKQRWRQAILDNNYEGVGLAVNGVMDREPVIDSLDRIDMPTLILVGEKDTATPPEKSERMQQQISHSRMTVIPGAGHTTPIEKPNQVNEEINDFLEIL